LVHVHSIGNILIFYRVNGNFFHFGGSFVFLFYNTDEGGVGAENLEFFRERDPLFMVIICIDFNLYAEFEQRIFSAKSFFEIVSVPSFFDWTLFYWVKITGEFALDVFKVSM
jgi:hypothetical protein